MRVLANPGCSCGLHGDAGIALPAWHGCRCLCQSCSAFPDLDGVVADGDFLSAAGGDFSRAFWSVAPAGDAVGIKLRVDQQHAVWPDHVRPVRFRVVEHHPAGRRHLHCAVHALMCTSLLSTRPLQREPGFMPLRQRFPYPRINATVSKSACRCHSPARACRRCR